MDSKKYRDLKSKYDLLLVSYEKVAKDNNELMILNNELESKLLKMAPIINTNELKLP